MTNGFNHLSIAITTDEAQPVIPGNYKYLLNNTKPLFVEIHNFDGSVVSAIFNLIEKSPIRVYSTILTALDPENYDVTTLQFLLVLNSETGELTFLSNPV